MEQKRGLFIHLSQKDIWIHESVLNTYLIVLVLGILSLYIYSKIKKADPFEKPKGLLHWVEIAVEGINSLTIQSMGKHNLGFAPYMMTIGMYLLVANLWGLTGLTAPTSDYNVTLALALITFVLIHFFSLKTKGVLGYFKQYTEPIAILTPINIIGEIANPISLSFRLFGNILSGALIMSLVYQGMNHLSRYLAPVVAAPLHGYFDVFAGVLQSLIFVMLSMNYINGNMAEVNEKE